MLAVSYVRFGDPAHPAVPVAVITLNCLPIATRYRRVVTSFARVAAELAAGPVLF